MGRITDALSKLKLNGDAAGIPFGKMSVKDMIKLLYHLAEVYDAEAILPEVTVKKKLQVFKKFARIHSLSHLLPSVKDMKNPRKCTRLVNTMLDMLEDKYSGDLYTRKSWPVACKELEKIDHVISLGSYSIDNLDLNPDAVPPGTPGASSFPGFKAVKPRLDIGKPEPPFKNEGKPSAVAQFSEEGAPKKTPPVERFAAGVKMTSLTVNAGGGENADIKRAIFSASKTSSLPRGIRPESNNIALGTSQRKRKRTKDPSKGETKSIRPATKNSNTKKRQLEESAQSHESKFMQKKLKTVHRASKQFIEALEDLSKSRPLVEVIGWDKAIFSNRRIWKTIKNLIFGRVLLGKELKKYNAKKVETATETQVIVTKKVSQEDIKTVKVKLANLMKQIRNAVPNELSEAMKCAVKSSCRNIKLRIRNAIEV